MNLRDLHYVLAVADTGNFKRAADQCHVSQPTLSMQIKKLEEELGVLLFERTNKNVMVTEAGARIVESARHVTQHEKNIRDIAKNVRDPATGDFCLGAIPTLASYIFPRFVPVIGAAYPQLQLLLLEEKTETLLQRLKQGKCDAALLALPVGDPALEEKELFEDAFTLAVGAEHPLAGRKSVRVDDLSGRQLLLLDEGHCLRDQALSVCHSHGAEEEKGFRTTSLETLRLMVQTHANFMTLMPSVAVHGYEGGSVRYIPFAGAKPSRRIGLVWRKTSARAGVMSDMARLLAKAYRHAPITV